MFVSLLLLKDHNIVVYSGLNGPVLFILLSLIITLPIKSDILPPVGLDSFGADVFTNMAGVYSR